jgi:hypothetical protein
MSAFVPILLKKPAAGCNDLSRREIADEDGYKIDDAVVMALVLLTSIVTTTVRISPPARRGPAVSEFTQARRANG